MVPFNCWWTWSSSSSTTTTTIGSDVLRSTPPEILRSLSRQPFLRAHSPLCHGDLVRGMVGKLIRLNYSDLKHDLGPQKVAFWKGDFCNFRENPGWWNPILLMVQKSGDHHLGCIKPCKCWDKLSIKWCRICSINSRVSERHQQG